MEFRKRQIRSVATLGALTAALAFAATPAQAAKFKDFDKLEVNGKVFVNAISVDGMATSAADDAASGAHFERAYFETRYHADDDNMIRITLDQKAVDGSVFVKYAYWQRKLGPVKIKVGQNHTPLVDYIQTHMWKHRYVQKTYADAVGAETSSDLGVSVLGEAGDMFDYYLSLMNGEGYTHTPDGAGYAFEGRVEVHASGAHVGLYGHTETKRDGVDNYDPQRELVYAWWENDRFEIGGQYLMADDGSAATKFDSGKGWNILANVKLPVGEKTTAFARYDTIDKKDTGTDETLTIAGVEFQAGPGIMLAPNVQIADDGTDTVTTVGVHGQFKF
jgi:hypothetical protein